jgi:phospholipase D1/2
MADGGRNLILQPGRTCWRLARADRFAFIVDGANYFKLLKAAVAQAQETVLFIGWDFDTRIRLAPDDGEQDWPDKLGRFINAVVERRPGLRVYVLKWDLGFLKTLGRGGTPLFIVDALMSSRVHLRLDHAHPLGACHHQKIVVIDDAIAFCGGIDVTVGRWDTREHLDDDARRKSPWGFRQEPWHDATAAVDGEAARALGQLARERWERATGERLEAPSPGRRIWPEGLDATFRQIEVGIARTQPHYNGQPEVREIEALYLAAIRRAQRTIYIESQYFASKRITDALADRLQETGGPEIVVINPASAEGWLEEEAMSTARALNVDRLRRADRERRFRIYFPVTAGGAPIYVHAKILIADERFFRVGSSNLNNRSMGLDTECDLAVEAVPGTSEAEALQARIEEIRNDLLAEHLGVAPSDVAAALREVDGSLIRAVENLRQSDGRTLKPLEPTDLNWAEQAIAETHTFDPERPEPFPRQLKKLVRRLDADVLGR